jgi:hypothetical protein
MSGKQWGVLPIQVATRSDKKDLRPFGILGFGLFTFIGLGIIFG